MEELINDYKRRLVTITETIETTKDTGSRNDIAKMARLKAKQGEYETFIAELQRSYRNYIAMKLDGLMKSMLNGDSMGTLRALVMLTIQTAKDMGVEVDVDFDNFTYVIK